MFPVNLSNNFQSIFPSGKHYGKFLYFYVKKNLKFMFQFLFFFEMKM